MLQGKRTRRMIAATLLTIMSIDIFSPTVTYALTSGPTAPEATSFEPVDTTDMINLKTGDFTYNLPLLEVPGPEGGYPLSLSYHAGIQPNEDASWVGLGWSLNTGAINRFVSGYPDDWENVTETRRDYWSGGSSFSIGIGYASSSISFGLTFSSDSYRGFDVGVSAGAGRTSIDLNTATGGSLGFSWPVARAQNQTTGSYISTSMGFNTNFESIKLSNSTRFSYKGIGIATGSDGGIQFNVAHSGAMGGASIINSQAGRISTSGFSLTAGYPVGDGFLGLSFSKRRYWSDESVSEPVNGSMYLNSKPVNHFAAGFPYADQYGFDTYFLHNKNEANLIEKPDPAPLQGGAYIDFDSYNVVAQGLGGMFRPYMFQGNVVSEYRPGSDGTRFKTKWFLPGDAQTIGHTNPQFRFEGDFSNKYVQNLQSDYADRNNVLHGTPPFDPNASFGDAQFTGFDQNKKKLEGSRHIDYFTNQDILNGTAKQSGFIAPVNAPGFTRSTQNTYYSYTSVNNSGGQTTVNVTDNSLGQQIGGFSITNENGVTYHFGLPAYSRAEQVYTERILKYNGGTVWNNLTKGKSYAYAWHLTTITGPDFVDKNGNGIADNGDYGYWVNFEFGKWTDSYNWRNPSQDFHRDMDNGYKSYSKGKKDVYYLNAVSTRSHTAVFEKDYRSDGYGVSDNAFIIRTDHANEDPGGFNSSSKGSLALTHIYLFDNQNLPSISASNGTALTSKPGEYQHNVIDKYDIAPFKNSIETSSLRIIDFNYDYSLAEHAINHLGSVSEGSGKLSLKSVFFRGVGAVSLLPPTRFFYELDPSQQVTGTITCTACDGSNPMFEFTSAASFKAGDILTVNGSQSYQCVVQSYNQATNTYKAKEIIDNNTVRPSPRDYNGTAVTTKNPWYNKDAYDMWGMFKPDYDQATIDQNENLGRSVNRISAASADAWSLRTVRTMMGDDIRINYEPDSYSKAVVSGMASLIMDKNNVQVTKLANGSTNLIFKLNLPVGNTINDFFQLDDVLEVVLLQYVSASPTFNVASINQVVIKSDELIYESGGIRFSSSVYGPGVYQPLKVTAIDNVSNTVTANTTLPFESEYTASHPGYIYFAYKGGNVLNHNNRMTYGGGVRVQSIGISNKLNNSITTTNYNYNIPGQMASSGVTSYEPGIFDVFDVPAEDATYFKETLYSTANDLLSLARELPPPAVMYRFVTVGQSIKKNGEPERTIEGTTRYEYEVFNSNMVWRHFMGGGTGTESGMAVKTVVLSMKKSLSRLGNLRHVTTFDDHGRKLSEVTYSYLHDGLEDLSPDQFYSQYQQRLRDLFGNQGLINERYLEIKQVGSGNDYSYTEKATMSGREEYPAIMTEETHFDYVTNTKATTRYIAFDFFSGAVTKTLNTDAYGNRFMTEVVPAYRKYGGMGMKITAAGNKNMLSATTASTVFKVDGNDQPVGLVMAAVQTWSNQVPVLDPNGNSVLQNNTSTDGNVWRSQASYVWQPPGISSDGLTEIGNFASFDWSSTPSATSNWKKNNEVTLYDVYSHTLEAKDINGNYTASKMDDDNKRVTVSGGPANYYEIAYSGAEGNGSEPAGINAVKYVNGYQGWNAHTGLGGLSLSGGGNKGFVYTVSTDKLVSGRNYAARVWANAELANADVKLYYKINGVEKATAAYTASSRNAESWRLLYLPVNGSDIVPGATLEVGCRNDNADASSVALDDFRFQPVNATTVAYVYDSESGALSHILDNNNIYSKFEYDGAGRLIRTYQEKMGIGEIKTAEYVYNNGCNGWAYGNARIWGEYFWRHDCPNGTAKPVMINVPADTYGSCMNQQHADKQARGFAQGEAYRLTTCGPRVYAWLEQITTHAITSCENIYRTTYTAHFFSDPEGINPLSVSDFPVLMTLSTSTNGGFPVIDNHWVTCNGTTTVIAENMVTSARSSCGGPITSVTRNYSFALVLDPWFSVINP